MSTTENDIVLILTRSDDNECVEMVSDAIRRKGGRPVRLDTDRFPTELYLAIELGAGHERFQMSADDEDVDLTNVTAIWHRRLHTGARIPRTLDPQLWRASVDESRATMLGLITSLRAFRMDPVQNIRLAENKPLQLRIAGELGLEIPRTLVSNDPASVRAFADRCDGEIVTKMMSSFAIYDGGIEQVVFTTPVGNGDLDDLDGLELCPMTFQELVPKSLELRSTIVGRRVFTASIDSQASERARIDWRREGEALADAWEPYELPAAVEERLLAMADTLGLNYGAVDLIVTPDGRHLFLEINPVGEFFWLELSPGLPISNAIADVLLGNVPRR